MNGNGKFEAVAELNEVPNPAFNEAESGDEPMTLFLGVVSYYENNEILVEESMKCYFAN